MELLYDFLFILGIILCLSFILVLYKNNNKIELPHKILISILFIFIFIFLSSYAVINKVGTLSIFTIPIVLSAKNVIPALLFFYVKSLFFKETEILKEHRTLLIFPIIFLILFILPGILIDTVYGLLILFNQYEQIEETYDIILLYRKFSTPIRIISNIAAITYLIICLSYFFKLKKAMKSAYSYIANNNFIWIRFLLIFPLIIVSIDSVFVFLEPFFLLNRWENTEIFTSCMLVLSILAMGYFGLKQTKIFVPYFLLNSIDKDENSKNDDFKNIDTTSKIEFESLEQKLKTVFETEKPYLNTDLTLGSLAKLIETTDKKMSILLNQHLNISFYEFINNYRVEAFKKALKENQYKDYTIEAISAECGFKSKASFYRIFKAKTNMSPSEYKKSIK